MQVEQIKPIKDHLVFFKKSLVYWSFFQIYINSLIVIKTNYLKIRKLNGFTYSSLLPLKTI
jgi:hypothetical protein